MIDDRLTTEAEQTIRGQISELEVKRDRAATLLFAATEELSVAVYEKHFMGSAEADDQEARISKIVAAVRRRRSQLQRSKKEIAKREGQLSRHVTGIVYSQAAE